TASVCFIEAVAKKSEGSGAGFQTALTQVGCRRSEIDLRFLSQHCGIGMTSVTWTNAKKISGRGSILAPKTHLPLVIIARHRSRRNWRNEAWTRVNSWLPTRASAGSKKRGYRAWKFSREKFTRNVIVGASGNSCG